MLCFAGQNMSRKMCGEACPADGCETVRVGRIMVGSAPELAVELTVARHFHT